MTKSFLHLFLSSCSLTCSTRTLWTTTLFLLGFMFNVLTANARCVWDLDFVATLLRLLQYCTLRPKLLQISFGGELLEDVLHIDVIIQPYKYLRWVSI